MNNDGVCRHAGYSCEEADMIEDLRLDEMTPLRLGMLMKALGAALTAGSMPKDEVAGWMVDVGTDLIEGRLRVRG